MTDGVRKGLDAKGSLSVKTRNRVWSGRRALVVLIAGLFLIYAAALAQSRSAADRSTLSTNAVSPVRFVAAHGERAVWMGYAQQGLEMWAYPVQVLSHYSIAIQPEGAARAIPGALLLRRIEVAPDMTTRVYVGSNFVVREQLFVPLDQPGAIVTYTVEGHQPVDIVVRFTPVLDLMWPAAVGGQSVEWRGATSDRMAGYFLSEPLRRFSAAIVSPDIVGHDPTENSALPTLDGLAFTVRPSKTPAGSAQARLFVGLDSGEATAAGTVAGELAREAATLKRQAAAHYTALMSNALRIETPDERVNQALSWAEIALDQAWVCNRDLGCGLVAGYGPSRNGRRPQYDWFFAGDGLIATDGLVAAGEYDRAREELEFILKYQDAKSGMIWHELSQSAGYLDWTGKYPYMFVHVDVTFQFLSTVARYVASSGDREFPQRHWAALLAAYRYCESQIDPSTKLPRIPAGKEGSNEQDRMSDDLGLSSAWLSTAESFAELADAAGQTQFATKARQAAAAARPSIAQRYWDPQRGFCISGHTDAGQPIFEERSSPGELVAQRVFTADENAILLDKLASSNFQSDWGTRGVSAAASTYDPDSYARGSVFALGSASMASTFWQTHRPATAEAIWRTLVPLNWLDALGHMHEVLAGDFYHQQAESVPEQTWSSAGFLDSTVYGLFGLSVQSGANRIVFAPHLPADWRHVFIANVRIGSGTLTLDMTRSGTQTALEVTNDGAPVTVAFDPEIPLGATHIAATCNGRAIATKPQRHTQDEHASIDISVPRGTARCDLRYHGGVEVMPDTPDPQVGDRSTSLKVIDISLEDHVLTAVVDAYAGKQASGFELRTTTKPEAIEGARIEAAPDDLFRVIVDNRSPSASGYARRTIRIRIPDIAPKHDVSARH